MEKDSTQNLPVLGGRYQLQQTLGSGGMAFVYKARDLMLERPVAIKVLREDFSQDPNFRERFRQEAKAAANLSHPNIVTVHDFGLDQGKLFIVMENVPGTDLKTMMKQTSRFSIEEAINLIVQACAGIGYAHRAGLIHCDVKPHNMLVSPDLRLKVTDFGIARALSGIHPEERHDVVWGSPQYFSPEQAAGAAPSPASDVYSLGVILYEMLTGQLPFISDDPARLAQMHRELAPVRPRDLNPAISPALEQILLKTLSKEPAGRYRTADQLGRILLSFSSQPSLHANSIPPAGSSGPYQVTSAAPVPSSPISLQENYSYPSQPAAVYSPSSTAPQKIRAQGKPVDWGLLLLGFIAALSAGGLIPFWLYIYLKITTPPIP